MNKRRIVTIQGNSPSQARLSDDPVDTILVFPLLAVKMEIDFFSDLMINLLALYGWEMRVAMPQSPSFRELEPEPSGRVQHTWVHILRI